MTYMIDMPSRFLSVFTEENRKRLRCYYPVSPTILDHHLGQNALMTIESLASLADTMPPKDVEYNLGDLPIGIDADEVPENGMGIGDTIRTIDTAQSWAVLKNIEQNEAYRALLHNLLGEIRDDIAMTTGEMMTPQGYIFISSPNSMTPFHFDPEHNILLQLRGSKTMTVFPSGDERFAPGTAHERYHAGGSRNLSWSDDFLSGGTQYHLTAGKALFVPVMAPHFVRNGPEPSISLSITWRSQYSYAEADAHAFNAVLRKFGVKPAMPKRYPQRSRVKALAWRAMRKAGMKANRT